MQREKDKEISFKLWKVILILAMIAAISGAILASVYSYTKEKIEYQEEQRIKRAIFSILPGGCHFEEKKKNSTAYYICKDEKEKEIALAFIAEGAGYQDLIEILVITDSELTEIKGIEILKSSETPGLGSKITKAEFKNQFQNASTNLKLSKDTSEKKEEETTIQAITGATISSQAVIDIVNEKIKQMKQLLK